MATSAGRPRLFSGFQANEIHPRHPWPLKASSLKQSNCEQSQPTSGRQVTLLSFTICCQAIAGGRLMGLRASGSLFHSAMLPIAHTGVGARNLLEPCTGMEIGSGIAITGANMIAQCTVHQMQHSQKREAANRGATNDAITHKGLDI